MGSKSDMRIKLDAQSLALSILEINGFSYDGLAPHKSPPVKYTGMIYVEGEKYPVAFIDNCKTLTFLNP